MTLDSRTPGLVVLRYIWVHAGALSSTVLHLVWTSKEPPPAELPALLPLVVVVDGRLDQAGGSSRCQGLRDSLDPPTALDWTLQALP